MWQLVFAKHFSLNLNIQFYIMTNLSITDKLQQLPQDMRQEAEDFIDLLLEKVNRIPDHVKEGVQKGQLDVQEGNLKSHEEVMNKYKRYL
uniref:DUF2281 domain-containing protein n=1 Tax=Sphingobacterium sp. (strain 21) TaxID=743722 RepID=F4CDF5_SPHS2